MQTAPVVSVMPIDRTKPAKKTLNMLSEKEKYMKMWTVDDYRAVSPGELAGNQFVQVVRPKKGAKVIDFGCGTGRGSFWLVFMGGMDCVMLDFAPNCLDQDVKNAMERFPEKFEFIEHDLTEESPVKAEYGYCTDVMEHIPTEDVDKVLANILGAARKVFFRISTEPDVMGPRFLNQHLHLTVQDFSWWEAKLIEHGCTIFYSENLGGAVDFYVSAWSQKLPEMEVNTDASIILEQIKENAKWGCKEIKPHAIQDKEIMILCGGPSLNDYRDEIIEKWKSGVKVVTVNGAYHWAQSNGMANVNQCMLDAREFNNRFVQPVSDDCLYFIASQCHPSVFECLPKDRVYYWHTTTSKTALDVIAENYPNHSICAGGSTVALRAIVLMRVLGFKNQTIYGMDSCLMDGEHHAYEQKENDGFKDTITVMIEDRSFECQPWMALQAWEWMKLMDAAGDEFNLTVKGNGLIAYIQETGARLETLGELA